jgi:hypothetical protein
MSGGIYEGPNGELLHGDGKPVGRPVTSSPAAPEPSHAAIAAAQAFVVEPGMTPWRAMLGTLRAAYAVDRPAAPLPGLTVETLAAALAEYEGQDGPVLPTGKARWLLARLAGSPGAPA